MHEIELVENPDRDLIDFFDKRIEEFNVARWEVKEKRPIAAQVKGEHGELVAGAAGKTFGYWLLLDNLWVAEKLRGHRLGSAILRRIEEGARERGCRFVLLETLDFQARPFYEKYGYQCRWTQPTYPREGAKHFMVKDLDIS